MGDRVVNWVRSRFFIVGDRVVNWVRSCGELGAIALTRHEINLMANSQNPLKRVEMRCFYM